MQRLIPIGVLSGALIFGGCVSPSPYTPSPDRPFESILEFTSQQSLSITNAQESTEEHEVSARMLADYHAWTDVAIQIAERELGARGVQFDAGASRSLSLAVSEVRFSVGFVKIETQIDMEVVTGDGYSAKYTGINISYMGAHIHRQSDGAIMRVVVEMLNDPKIVSYLGQ